MPHAIVTPTVSQELEWKDLRVALKNCIKEVVDKAVIYSSWPLKYDIGQTIKLLTSKADGGKVHAWMISINRAEPDDVKAGGYNLEWELNVRIWGFLGYEKTYEDTTQDTIEKEVRAITQVLYANRKHLGLNDTSALKNVELITWEDIDVQAFGSGDDVHVAQGNLKITLQEFYSGY